MLRRFKRKFGPLLFVVLLSSCSSDPNSVARTPTAVKDSLYSLEGKSLEFVLDNLGLPDEVEAMGKSDLYIFKNQDGDWYCNVKLLVSDDDIVSKVSISANTVYMCPSGRRS